MDDQLTPEQLVELRAKADKADQLEAELKEKEEALNKAQKKEINFAELRKASKEERAKLMEEFSEKERAMAEEILAVRSENEESKREAMQMTKESVLEDLAGENGDLRKSIEEQAKEFIGDPKSPQELESRLRKAYTLVTSQKPRNAPLNRFVPSSSYTNPSASKQKFVQTPEGRETFKQFFGRYPKDSK